MGERTDSGGSLIPRLAGDILAAERKALDDGSSVPEACAAVLQRLYGKLRPIVGSGGFEMLLGRAVILASRSRPALASLELPPTGPPTAKALADVLAADPGDPRDPARPLLGELLGFAGYLMGWRLLITVLRGLWPEATSGYEADALEAEPRGSGAPPRREEG